MQLDPLATSSDNMKLPNSSEQLLTSSAVMARLGYKDRGSFWQLVYREGIPHVRLNRRVIRFPSAGLEAWLQRRSSEYT